MRLNRNHGNFISAHVQVISMCLFSYPARTKLGIHAHSPRCENNVIVCTLAMQMIAAVDIRVFTWNRTDTVVRVSVGGASQRNSFSVWNFCVVWYIKIDAVDTALRVCEPILSSELGAVSLLLILLQLRDGKFGSGNSTANRMQFLQFRILLSPCDCRCNRFR